MGVKDYIELRAHSAYSLLRGTSPPEVLVAEAARLGMRGLALTDHNNVYGAVSFQKTAQALDIAADPGRRTHRRMPLGRSQRNFGCPPP